MKTAAGVAQTLDEQTLDEAMDVFIAAADEIRRRVPLLEDVCQRLLDLAGLLDREHARFVERARPRRAACDIVLEEASIEPEGSAELERVGVRRRVKPS